MADVLVVTYAPNGAVSEGALELLGGAAALAAQVGGSAKAVVLGAGVDAAALAKSGATTIFVADDASLATYQPERLLQAITQVAKEGAPALILFPADNVGRELAPRLAHRLGGGAVADVMGVRYDEAAGQFVFRKSVFGGKAEAEMAITATPAVATVRARVFAPAPSGEAAEVRQVPVPTTTAATEVLERVEEKREGVALEDAKIIVSGGRGLGGPEPFQLLQQLADLLGAGVGASRAAVDEGWVPPSYQIGQTGKTVAPELYIAVGISGASQHMVGIQGAKNILAINTDPEAPMFQAARLGVVADYKTFIPAFIKALQDAGVSA